MTRVLAALFVVLIACTPNDQLGSTVGSSAAPTPTNGITATVERVADGDSFRASELEVRLAEVNAPEQDECFGEESREFLTSAIEGEEISLQVVGLDQFDRTLAHVYHGDLWVNLAVVQSGYALAMSFGAPEILASEAEARASEIGMWGAGICSSNDPRAELEIVEIDFNPPGNDSDERVTIRNPGTSEVDLAGFVLRDESSVNRFEFEDITLAAGAEVVVSTACQGASDIFEWCTEQPVWNNEGDTALLLDSFGRVVALYRYP